mmetsp:Transcript_39017/g.87254  ORF Transcript_39017/g.87254 Transcript_39017/m.87254 type:complete len:282 (-) Transcript_39017:19-864(-)
MRLLKKKKLLGTKKLPETKKPQRPPKRQAFLSIPWPRNAYKPFVLCFNSLSSLSLILPLSMFFQSGDRRRLAWRRGCERAAAAPPKSAPPLPRPPRPPPKRRRAPRPRPRSPPKPAPSKRRGSSQRRLRRLKPPPRRRSGAGRARPLLVLPPRTLRSSSNNKMMSMRVAPWRFSPKCRCTRCFPRVPMMPLEASRTPTMGRRLSRLYTTRRPTLERAPRLPRRKLRTLNSRRSLPHSTMMICEQGFRKVPIEMKVLNANSVFVRDLLSLGNNGTRLGGASI